MADNVTSFKTLLQESLSALVQRERYRSPQEDNEGLVRDIKTSLFTPTSSIYDLVLLEQHRELPLENKAHKAITLYIEQYLTKSLCEIIRPGSFSSGEENTLAERRANALHALEALFPVANDASNVIAPQQFLESCDRAVERAVNAAAGVDAPVQKKISHIDALIQRQKNGWAEATAQQLAGILSADRKQGVIAKLNETESEDTRVISCNHRLSLLATTLYQNVLTTMHKELPQQPLAEERQSAVTSLIKDYLTLRLLEVASPKSDTEMPLQRLAASEDKAISLLRKVFSPEKNIGNADAPAQIVAHAKAVVDHVMDAAVSMPSREVAVHSR